MNKKAIEVFICLVFFIPFLSVKSRAENTTAFRFAVTGCIHMGLCDPVNLELVVDKIKSYNPDFTVFLGGMVSPTRTAAPQTIWKAYDRISSTLKMPVYHLSGTCQQIALQLAENPGEARINEQCWGQRYKQRYFTKVHENNLFIFLDSDTLQQEISGNNQVTEQIDFLKSSLSGNERYKNIFLLMHKSLWLEKNWSEMICPIIKNKVQYVFSASATSFAVKTMDDVKYISLGTDSSYLPQLLLIEVADDKVNIQTVIPMEFSKKLNSTLPPMRIETYILRSAVRNAFLLPDRVVDALRIKPGMTIVDIGAGDGLFTCLFSEALKGTGRVFATEVNPEMLEAMKNNIRGERYSNVTPVLVEGGKVDGFYKKNKFDIIFLSESYQFIMNPIDYFSGLRPFLTEGTGRLYIILFKNDADFSEIEFGDFTGIIKTLQTDHRSFPVFRKLDKDLRDFVLGWSGGNIPAGTRVKIIDNFNRILQDRSLFNDVRDYIFEPGSTFGTNPNSSIALAKYLWIMLDSRGVFENTRTNITAQDKKISHQLNRIFLTGIFKLERLAYLQGYDLYVEKESVIKTLEAAGFKFVKARDLLPYYNFLEFKR